VGLYDAALAKRLHTPHQERPYTVSDLLGPVRSHHQMHLSPEQTVSIRLTSYSPHLTAILLHKIVPALEPTVSLLGAPLQLICAARQHAQHPSAAQTSFQKLISHYLGNAPVSPSLTMHFLSPTVFRSQGNFLPLPLPRLVFAGLARRWNLMAPVKLAAELEAFVEKSIVISSYQLQTQKVRFGPNGTKGEFNGFMGFCRYAFRQKDIYLMRQIQLLRTFALFAGVGLRTTMGLGQVYPTGKPQEWSLC
jgi:CRISPR-associated endoribonuclease Cas6